MIRSALSSFALILTLSGCAAGEAVPTTAPAPDGAERQAQLIADIRTLSSDAMQGRRTGTEGSARARAYLLGAFERHGLLPFGDSYEHPFTFTPRGASGQLQGVNLLGYIRGSEHPERFIVVTAHYDHVGIGRPVNGDSIYNGADDNASGTAALFALAHHFRQHPPRNSILFAALDAEEMGLQGARAFVASPPVPREALAININMDMISRSERDELFAVGTYHYPFLRPYVERVAARAPLTLTMGHDRPGGSPRDDWTMLSDQGAFHEVGIPFLYFGVADHEDYHRPSDTFENIDPDFYLRAVETVIDLVAEVDRNLSSIMAEHRASAAGAALPAGR